MKWKEYVNKKTPLEENIWDLEQNYKKVCFELIMADDPKTKEYYQNAKERTENEISSYQSRLHALSEEFNNNRED